MNPFLHIRKREIQTKFQYQPHRGPTPSVVVSKMAAGVTIRNLAHTFAVLSAWQTTPHPSS